MITETHTAAWQKEAEMPFQGWDFAYLDGRMLQEQAPWSYSTRAKTLMAQADSVLDIGTGGGERYLAMRDHWPAKVVATEEYLPNLKLSRERLEPHGVTVDHVRLTRHDPMPYADGEFELLINRHSAFNSAELGRILAPNGTFLTQQIHGLWAESLIAAFGTRPQWPDATPDTYIPLLENAGLTIIDAQNFEGELRFTDVGAIVYYLNAVPWLVPDFARAGGVDTYADVLLGFQAQLDNGQPLVFEARTYLIEAHKPAA